MQVLGVVIVESVLVNIKAHSFPDWIVDCEYSIIVDIIGNSENSLDVFQNQKIVIARSSKHTSPYPFT